MKKNGDPKRGYICRVVACDMGHRCGYVGMSEHSIYFGKDYSDPIAQLNERIEIFFDVHGGLTFSGKFDDSPLWWFGYDCAHSGDGKDLSLITNEKLKELYESFNEGSVKGTTFCIQECESLAKQMQKFDPYYQRKEKLEKLLA